ncbi:Tannase/feruloyl esterase [Xylariaceae sp. FL0662B]|nr:Tannase/feruloyl esterase [Xylariaceae sp. FL0662B]
MNLKLIMSRYICHRRIPFGVAVILAWVVMTSSAEDRIRTTVACDIASFGAVLPQNAKVERVDAVAAGSTYGEGDLDLSYPVQPVNLPALCAVTVTVASSANSTHRFAAFLPAEWNSRFLAVGNGGFGGGINWLDMSAGVRYGFAVVSTDTGHNSSPNDVSWGLNNPEARTDWGWRAMHAAVSIGKRLTLAYYLSPIDYSYYSGCSTGGRQGLKELQLYPESFDGVLVGAAAWYTSHLNTWVTKVATYNWPAEDPKHIPWERLPAVGDEIVRQCDGVDGVKDGIISLPHRCKIDYSAMLCGDADSASKVSANASACLTKRQIATLQNIYSDWLSPDDGTFLYTGLWPGSENQMDAVLNYSDGSPYGIGYARYFLYDDPLYSLHDFNDSAVSRADKLDPGAASAADTNLTTFRNRGGKLLMYHGTADGLVPTRGSNWYYDNVMRTTGSDTESMRTFFRYFLVPGMEHCWMTPVDAPWAFGGASQAAMFGNDTYSVPGYNDAEHDALLALMDWVERDVPVDQIVATTWRDPVNTQSGVLRQRPLCPYPQMAKWDGEGDVNDAGSWNCGGDISDQFPSSAGAPAVANPFSVIFGVFRSLSMYYQ